MSTPVVQKQVPAPESPANDADGILRRGMDILEREAGAIKDARSRLGSSFVEAVRLILGCSGRIAVSGLGKAGNIGVKIQATLASTGTPAYVLHPVEALHGDLGMIRPQDVLLGLSKSGETQELVCLFPRISKIGCRVILLTARTQSKCAQLADVVIDIGDTPEACPLGMAPSSSTAAMLAVGDALALTVMEKKNIRPEQYAVFHPSGALGRSLMRVREIMRTGADCPTVRSENTLLDYHHVVQQAPRRAGAAVVVDDHGKLIGIVTHGDLSRLLGEPQHPAQRPVGEVMTRSPKTVRQNDFVADALRLMEAYRIDEVPVVDDRGRVAGMIDVQDLIAEGFSGFGSG